MAHPASGFYTKDDEDMLHGMEATFTVDDNEEDQ